MRAWNYKGKIEVGRLLGFRLTTLKDYGLFKNSLSGAMVWKNEETGKTNNIGIQTKMNGDAGQLHLFYSQISENKEKEDFDYNIQITSTPCPYGGRRFWFTCPLTVNGKYCGRRTNVFYKRDGYFGCHVCQKLTYASQNQSGGYKGFVSIPDIDKAEKEIKRWYYRGKPTRKYRRFLRLNEKFRTGLAYMYLRLKKMV